MDLKSFYSICKQYRWKTIGRVTKSIGRKIGISYESFYLMKLDSSRFISTINIPVINAIEIKNINQYNLDAFKFSDKKIELFKQRIADNTYSCYGYIQDNQLVYITWVSWEKMNYPNFFQMVEDLEAPQALLEDSYCLPLYRGRGIHSEMNLYRLKAVFNRGKKEALVLILKENIPALKVQSKSGFEIDSVIVFRKIFNRKQIIKKVYENS